ncbi:MAG: (2Fe-2S)-binding protein [Myxococcota bacterium]
MIVCLCEGVSDREIKRAARRGASTVGAVARTTGAGTGCGRCRCTVRDLLRQVAQHPDPGGEPSVPLARQKRVV